MQYSQESAQVKDVDEDDDTTQQSTVSSSIIVTVVGLYSIPCKFIEFQIKPLAHSIIR